MPGANDTVRRCRHQTGREPRGPGVQHFAPWTFFELIAEELEPILGATLVANRCAPIVTGEARDSCTSWHERMSIALEPRHYGVASIHRTHRFDSHRRMV